MSSVSSPNMFFDFGWTWREPTIVQGIHSALHDGAQRRGDEFEARASASGGVDGAGSKTSEEFPYYPPQPPIIHVSTPQQNEAITELSLLFELLAALEVASLEERRQNSVAMPLKCGDLLKLYFYVFVMLFYFHFFIMRGVGRPWRPLSIFSIFLNIFSHLDSLRCPWGAGQAYLVVVGAGALGAGGWSCWSWRSWSWTSLSWVSGGTKAPKYQISRHTCLDLVDRWGWSLGGGVLELESWSWSLGAGVLELESWSARSK